MVLQVLEQVCLHAEVPVHHHERHVLGLNGARLPHDLLSCRLKIEKVLAISPLLQAPIDLLDLLLYAFLLSLVDGLL